ncbi:cell wall hydrolase [Sphingosinicella rhizophila]|uniref:Cell wall hydrolase n=1 Tax=Sphingosinicella rhizophila TaxID=3050082 RepID=A0ABU3Q4I4_9SPHN|nr:cell wall hydrolase [Sphingosinicella sp. GR2756]MDT9598327.1 cell wall hydrolase [Sphingosinicella sp. GR2756]
MLSAGIILPPRPSLPERRQWVNMAVLAMILLLNLFAGLSLVTLDQGSANAKVARGALASRPSQSPPAPEPLAFRDVPPQDALAINASIPVSTLPNPAAQPFAIRFASEFDQARSLECLTAAVYYEAAIEPPEGQRAVAQVVLNRVRHPAYPRSVCGVVFQGSDRATGCQFTFTCDGSLRRTPSAAGWERARKVAEEALAGKVYKPVGWATHYHTNWVVPYWSSSLVKAANVGTHIFYRWTGGWGRAPAFRYRPTGVEPAVAQMAHLTSAPADAAGAAADPADIVALTADMVLPVAPNVDMAHRPIVRRYEPLSREQATASAIARTGETASTSLKWALAGGTAGAPLGQKVDGPTASRLPAQTRAAPAAPAAPRCLQGVRRLGDKVQGPVETGC